MQQESPGAELQKQKEHNDQNVLQTQYMGDPATMCNIFGKLQSIVGNNTSTKRPSLQMDEQKPFIYFKASSTWTLGKRKTT